MQSTHTKPLLIGVGNDFAGDDVAGRLLARRLRGQPRFDVAETHGAAADLVTLFEGRRHVVVVDACRSGAAPGTLHRFDARADDLSAFLTSVSSHGIGVAEGVALARALDGLPDICAVVAVEGAGFRLGDPVHPAVQSALDTLAAELAATLGA